MRGETPLVEVGWLVTRRRAMRVLSPLGVAEITVQSLARRRPTLAGCRIGVLDNSKPNADVLIGRVAELLAERTGAASIRRWTKPGSSRPAQNLDEIAAAVDVVLTGSAD
jgi:hypothetical protein